MLRLKNITVTDRAAEYFRRERARRHANARPVTLIYMTSFTNPDGSTVEGFAPGYTIDFEDWEPGDHWVMATLADGTEIWFMPEITFRPDESYVVDLASSYTLSIGPRNGGDL